MTSIERRELQQRDKTGRVRTVVRYKIRYREGFLQGYTRGYEDGRRYGGRSPSWWPFRD